MRAVLDRLVGSEAKEVPPLPRAAPPVAREAGAWAAPPGGRLDLSCMEDADIESRLWGRR